MDQTDMDNGSDIAIIGVEGRFPGAANLEQFWELLRDGREGTTHFSERELRDAGIDEAKLNNPGYVRANNIILDVDQFDADFFDISAKEAELIDPQQRSFLESAHSALESAGYNPDTFDGQIGVYAGTGMNNYILQNLQHKYSTASAVEKYQMMLANDKDFLSTRVSYKLNLMGPSININTACSTSLVVVHIACLSLLNGECDMALAGSSSIRFPQVTGYEYLEGMIFSPDGHCRAFDRNAKGTVLGDGVGVVVLKRMADALADNDTIHAVIKSTAINNDGSLKTGYSAPSVNGQARVVAEAQALADIDPASITYVEAHGTGTVMGDPIEVAGLTQAFREKTEAQGFCALGSVKTNIGHLDVAAGMAGLIKTVLMLKHRKLVPSLNYQDANPEIDFARSPFYVNTDLLPWDTGVLPRRAGVSSFGIGGTNAHIVVEEAPEREVPTRRDAPHLLILSAKTETALDATLTNMAAHLKKNTDVDMGDVSHTLAVGRKAHRYRCFAVCDGPHDAAMTLVLRDEDRLRMGDADESTGTPDTVFVLSDHASDAAQTTQGELYSSNSAFREAFDEIARHLNATDDGNVAPALARCALNYALAKMWISLGIAPRAMVGCGLNQYVMAAVAGVCTPGDALALARAHAKADRGGFETALSALSFATASLPYICSVTGDWITDEQIMSPDYWYQCLENSKPRGELLANLPDLPSPLLLVFGPTSAQGPDGIKELSADPTLVTDPSRAVVYMLGSIWLNGSDVNWVQFYGPGAARVPLPTYPFERKRYWIEPDELSAPTVDAGTSTILRQLSGAPLRFRPDMLAAYIQSQLSEIVGKDFEQPDSDLKFLDMGLTSLILIELSARLAQELDQPIPASTFIEYPTVGAFCDLVLGRLDSDGEVEVKPLETDVVKVKQRQPRKRLRLGAS